MLPHPRNNGQPSLGGSLGKTIGASMAAPLKNYLEYKGSMRKELEPEPNSMFEEIEDADDK